jgi:hypothetical protein
LWTVHNTGPDAWRCIEMLTARSQVRCLGDLEQQIFDHLPGIGQSICCDLYRSTPQECKASLNVHIDREDSQTVALGIIDELARE